MLVLEEHLEYLPSELVRSSTYKTFHRKRHCRDRPRIRSSPGDNCKTQLNFEVKRPKFVVVGPTGKTRTQDHVCITDVVLPKTTVLRTIFFLSILIIPNEILFESILEITK